MSCSKCKKSSCTGCPASSSSSSAQTEAILAELQDQIDTLIENTKAFACGHPILLIQNVDDVAQFNSDSLGTGCWEKWAICDGKTHVNPITKKPFVTPNFTDRFIVQAGGAYVVGDIGGLDSVTLTIPELPAHNHGVVDPGHIHDINDPGHIHPISDDMHVHQAIADPHNHHVSLSMGTHTHNYRDEFQDDVNIGFVTVGPLGTQGFLNSSTPGEVTVASAAETFETRTTDGGTGGTATGYTDNATQQVTISPAATGIEVLNALTGIDETETGVTGITTSNTGSDMAHENRPPYYSCLYVIKWY